MLPRTPSTRGRRAGGLFRGGLAGLLPKACGSLPPAPPAPPGRAELERRLERGGWGRRSRRAEADRSDTNGHLRSKRPGEGRQSGQYTGQRTPPTEGSTRGSEATGCAKVTEARGQADRGRRAAEEGCTEEAAGSGRLRPRPPPRTKQQRCPQGTEEEGRWLLQLLEGG